MRGRELKLKIDIYSKPQLKYKNPVEGTRTLLTVALNFVSILKYKNPVEGTRTNLHGSTTYSLIIEIREPRGGDENCVEDGFFRNDGIIEIREPRGGDENSA